MIVWTIPTAALLTGATTSQKTGSGTLSVLSTSSAGNFQYTTSHTSSHTFSGLSSTSNDGWTTTTFVSSTGTTVSGRTFVTSLNNTSDSNFGLTSSTTTFTGSYSSTASGTSAPTGYVQTSTTETYESTYSLTASSTNTAANLTWTTSRADSNATTVQFYKTTGEFTYFYTLTATRQATQDGVTVLSDTVNTAEAATVYQANTRDEQAEVLYYLSAPGSTWGGYRDATAEALSGTRFTVPPQLALEQMFFVDQQSTSTFSFSNAGTTQTLSWKRTTNIPGAVTLVTTSALPHSTATSPANVLSTTSTSGSWFTVSDSFSGNNRSASSSTLVSYGTWRQVVTRQSGSVSFETTATTTRSFTRVISVEGKTTVASASNSVTTLADSKRTIASGETYSVESARFLSKPKVGVGTAAKIPARLQYCAKGFADGTSTGLFLTANASFSGASYALAGGDTNATIVAPGDYTLSGNSLSWLTTIPSGTGQTTTVSTLSFSAAGSTFEAAVGAGNPSHFGGRPGSGFTFVQTAPPGAYKDQNGLTTSADANATVLVYGDDFPARRWHGIAQINPLSVTENLNGIVWAAARNSTALPPA